MSSEETTPTTPEIEAAATDKGALPLQGLTLLGTLTGGDAPRALLRRSGGRIVMAELGDTVFGRKVEAIGESEVILTQGNRSVRLNMPGA